MARFKTSLAEWMIANLGEDALEKYWSNKNEVNPWDISYGSKNNVWFICQDVEYHESYKMKANSFTSGQRCPYCKRTKVIHPRDSLGQWMIDNLGEDSIDKYWSNRNIEIGIDPWNIAPRSNKKIWIKCANVDYHEVYGITPDRFTHRRDRCPACRGLKVHPKDSFAQWCIDNIDEDFIKKYWSSKNKIDPFKLAKCSSKDIYIKCPDVNYHDDYKTTPNIFISLGSRCPYCSHKGNKIHPHDSLGSLRPEVISLWSNKNTKSPFSYFPNSNQEVYWKCENDIHDEYERSIDLSKKSCFRCPKCVEERKESIIQEKVRLFLTKELNYKVNHEHNCQIECINPKTNRSLPYDNELLINTIKLIIEVHGIQHYKITTWAKETAKKKGVTLQEELEYQQWKDQYKMDYAISQEYHYLVIPYWTDNDMEEWKSLITNKLNEILKEV